ncbi:unnamed protein product [Ilex paraguariensis]|uniref:Disease resistance protein RGA3 n=1 Tax=Ilex paraguariensis TaxID=185542 RepID=A0ABC8RQR1_9AQUA
MKMADLVLPLLLQVLVEKLASPFLEKFHDLFHLRENIKQLQASLPMVQGFLEDAQNRRATEQEVEDWMLKLKDIAFESEDLLDEIAVEIILCERRGSSISKQVRSLFLPYEPSKQLFDLICKLQNKLKELDEIAKKGTKLNFREGGVVRQSESLGRKRGTGSFVIKSEIYGREEDKKNLLELLLPTCRGKTMGNILVIPIVGIGGLGKTALARLVYNDEKVAHYFGLKIWVYVSENFDVRKIIRTVIESATGTKCELLEMDLLQLQLQKSLSGKRFLLVLDDVWNEDQEEWEELGDLLRHGVEGSRVMVTTRSTKVASITGTTSLYHLQGLCDDDCWALFKKQAFSHGEEGHPHLMAIGKRIIKKCGGVPLAAKTLGSLLRFKREQKDWLFVEESELWNHKECQSHILPALRLSYVHLPLYLKQCFVFCALFPKYYEIKKEKLIHMWMAGGLILPQGGNRLLEDIGDEYFNDLLCFCFFQEVERCADGNILYKMHDLIHDLARFIGGHDFAILEHGVARGNLAQTRHSSVVCNFDLSSFPKDLFKAKCLRTLLLLSPGGNTDELPSILPMSFIYLRILDLSGCGIKRLHESISALICLRYLDLSSTSIQTLPHTICNLCNLQTLNLSGCYNLVELPFSLASLISLRHLNVFGCEGLIHMPAGIGNLVHLQTLPTYIVGKEIGQGIGELKSLNLRGELNLKCLENVRDAKAAAKANMKGKKHLHSLRFQWGNSGGLNFKPAKGTASREVTYRRNLGSSGSSHEKDSDAVEDILECLEPHPNLTKLFIKGYSGIKFPDWVLPNLVVVVLINCRRCKNLPTLGQLPFLKSLCLQGMDSVLCIAEDFYSGDTEKPFPSLKDLTLEDFPSLEEWSSIDDREAFTCLQKLTVDKCPNLTTTPKFPVLQHLELRDCHPKIMNSMECVTSLSTLVIHTFPELLHLSRELLKNNKSLTSLEIRSCPNLRSLPSELENLTALKFLIISCCEELTKFPLGLQKLKALEVLEISGCHKMVLLPEEGIGEGLQRLSTLQHLSIQDCPHLERLCKKKRGKQWERISHIPHIYIGSLKLGKELSSSTC